MTPRRILVTGASGFIGTRLCERLALEWRIPFRALVHGYGRAARLGRLDAEIVQCDLTDFAATERAAAGCDAVVHLAYGRDSTRQTESVLRASARLRIERFVHISSMAVHGPSPGPECAVETSATIGRYNSAYSDSKAEIEELVQRSIDRGEVAGIILRPTVVYGPYSPFVLAVVQAAGTGVVTLIDEGRGICNAVYVDDVCSAIHRALLSESGLGLPFFVNGDSPPSWRDFNLTFAKMVSPDVQVISLPSEELLRRAHDSEPWLRANLRALGRLFGRPDLYDLIATVPAFGAIATFGKRQVKRALGEQRLFRLRGIRPFPVVSTSAYPIPNEGRVRREIFPIAFSNARAGELLGWRPDFGFPEGAEATRAWLQFTRLVP